MQQTSPLNPEQIDNFIRRVLHRADYLDVLLTAAKDHGVEIKLDSEVQSVDFDTTEVRLVHGEVVKADVIVGADGGLQTLQLGI